jgi:hypothetical protein
MARHRIVMGAVVSRMARHRIVMGAVVFLTAGIAIASAQSEFALSTLTVPASNLPDGCQLAPVPPRPSPFVLSNGAPLVRPPYPGNFPENPWSGIEDRYRTQVQDVIEPPRVAKGTDAPLTPRDAIRTQWAGRGVVTQAYHAIYQDAGGASVVVHAARYDDPAYATAVPKRPNRLVRGTTVIDVIANQPTGCLNAVLSYIQSLK